VREGEATTESEPSEAEVEHEIASCDLGGNLDELIGSVSATSSGSDPVPVTVSFKWQLGDGSFIEAPSEQVELEPDQEELIFFSKQVSISDAGSFQDHPGYYDGTNCQAEVSVGG